MYKIFERKYDENNGIIRPPDFELVKRVYEDQVESIANYYRDNVKLIKNQHLLIRMLNLFMPSIDYDLETFVSIVYTRSAYIAKHFRLTSEIETGVMFQDLFYTGDNIVIYNEESFSIFKTIAKWKTASAVRVLKHPITSGSFLIPYPDRYPTIESGLSIVSINLPMMLIQYREYLKEQLLKPDGERAGAMGFVSRYVLPNMLYSHVDLVIFNRLRNIYYKKPNIDTDGVRHPFMVINYNRRIDKVLEVLIKYMSNRQLPYYSYLKLIPAIFTEDAQEALLMPNIVKTRRDWWCLYLSRLDEMVFLIDIGKEVGYMRNRDLISKAKIDIYRLLRENIYQNVLPEYMIDDTLSKLNRILEI